jgi:hypothetical protein
MAATIQPMRPEDLAVTLGWAAAEGWNPGLADAEAFWAADPGGFLGAICDDGTLGAAVSRVRYSDDFAFLGLYICRPDLWGTGLGFRLWTAAMAHAGSRTLGLDGVLAQQANYRKFGFIYAHRNVRYAGPAPAVSVVPPEPVPITAAMLDVLTSYDAPLFGAARPDFLRAWTAIPSHRALAVVAADGSLKGYGVLRPCLSGFKVGPLFADSPAIAEALALALLAPIAGQTVILDIPEPNLAAEALAKRLGLTPVFETARMYAGPAPALPLERIFGITTFELG